MLEGRLLALYGREHRGDLSDRFVEVDDELAYQSNQLEADLAGLADLPGSFIGLDRATICG